MYDIPVYVRSYSVDIRARNIISRRRDNMMEKTPTPAPQPKKAKDKVAPKNLVIPPKKPKLSKAERRALQEAQRAAKGVPQKKSAKTAKNVNKPDSGKSNASKAADASRHANTEEASVSKGSSSSGGKVLGLFEHLPKYKGAELFSGRVSLNTDVTNKLKLHPAVTELGYKYANGTVRGANKRCHIMLETFKTVIRDYQTPKDGKQHQLNLDLGHEVKTIFQYWTTNCRTHSVSMGNAMTFLKSIIASLPRDMNDNENEAKELLCEQIDAYIHERIHLAGKAIAEHALRKIQNGDVLLVYVYNEAVLNILINAQKSGTQFRVILVDSRPLMEGRAMLDALVKANLDCTYILLNSLSYMMKDVTKVLLGAAALMSNGSVLSRVGTAGIALMAHACNVPVLICCETYKISPRVQLESITYNEMGDPKQLEVLQFDDHDDLYSQDNKGKTNLTLLNLLYDLTPAEFVSGIITEMGILPPSSVAVLLREMNPQDTMSYR